MRVRTKLSSHGQAEASRRRECLTPVKVFPNLFAITSAKTMSWLFELHRTQPIAHAIGALAFVCVLGMALGSLKIRRIGLGTAGVLFAGTIILFQ
jgi:hypothetical protein